MKKNFLYLFCIFCFINCSSTKHRTNYPDSIAPNKTKKTLYAKLKFNTIDKLKTTNDVIEFIKSVNPKFAENKYRKFLIKSTDTIANDLYCGGLFKKWNSQNWEKIDINNDGKTDLLFISYWYDYMSFVIIDEGGNHFKLFRLSNSITEECEFAKPIQIRQKNELLLYHSKSVLDDNSDYKSIPITDTLTYKFDSFIEINVHEGIHYDINSIEFISGGSSGFSPEFELSINNQGYANFKGIDFVNFKGKSSKSISLDKFHELKQMLEYIKVKDLKNNYDVPWTDDQTVILKIKFADGSIKEIRDYGLQGTFGLSSIYTKLIKIGTETDWK